MIHRLTQEEGAVMAQEFRTDYRPYITNKTLSDLFGRKVKGYKVKPFAIREDDKALYLEARIFFKDEVIRRFWKHYLDWGLSPNRAGTMYRDPFTEKNEEDYLKVLKNEGYVPEYDWTFTFQTEHSGAEKTSRIISMEYFDMNLLDFVAPFSSELNFLRRNKRTHTKRIGQLEDIITKIYKIAININAFNDALINMADSEPKKGLISQTERIIKSEYLHELRKTYLNAIAGALFSQSFELGKIWRREIGAELINTLNNNVADTLADFQEMESCRNVRFHPEHILVRKRLTARELAKINPDDAGLLIECLNDRRKSPPYSNFAVTDYRMMRTSLAFSNGALINYMPLKNLDIGLTGERRNQLFEHALFVDYALKEKKICHTSRPPLKFQLPNHLKQAEAATIYYLMANAYVLTMFYKGGKMGKQKFANLMHERIQRMKEEKGQHGEFEVLYHAFERMYTFTLGKKE